ncbi:hypothetical protein Ataiwa_00200 [Algoriphagus taiwanensis]|uniref:Uncharacterized protein n=1 Tax=Algoriphagus taiwanensis TaxID=1445656 RepID=A0ABQ6PX36_9BACT|nr:hypothetical protein Ataiwa_00200 [Algoriphagus taiwanensis]
MLLFLFAIEDNGGVLRKVNEWCIDLIFGGNLL